MKIRAATEADRDAIWNIFHEIVAGGDTYAFDPKMPREEALAYWFRADTHAYVAEVDAESVGEADSFPGTATPSPTGKDRSSDHWLIRVWAAAWGGPSAMAQTSARASPWAWE